MAHANVQASDEDQHPPTGERDAVSLHFSFWDKTQVLKYLFRYFSFILSIL